MRDISIVVNNHNEGVTPFETIDAIKKLDLKMYLFNGMMMNGNIAKKNN